MAVVLAGLLVLALMCACAYALGLAFSKRAEPMRDRLATWRWERAHREEPEGRPIEAIAADLHRLGTRFHGLHPHASFAKVEAVRTAYDRALGECCAALGVAHLLAVLPVGPELDAERERVEEQLSDNGVKLPHAA